MRTGESNQAIDGTPLEAKTQANGVPFDTIIILGRGGYGAAPRQELERLVKSVARSGCFRTVRYAFIEQGEPALPAVLDQCFAAGARRLLVVPALVPMDRTLRWWLPLALRDWLREHAADDVAVALAPPLGDSKQLAVSVSAAAMEARAIADIRDDPSVKERRRSWSHIPAHRYQVLLCHGPRCTMENAPAVWEHLHAKLNECKLKGAERVMAVRTGCLYPCDLGPIMVVHPDGTWYGGVDEAAVDRIVAEHLVGGNVAAECACVPGAATRRRTGVVGG